MQHYSYRYSIAVVRRFVETWPRGWACVQKNTDDFYLDDLVRLFQSAQIKWNTMKKLIKMVDRTWRPNYYTYVELKHLYKYFENYAALENVHLPHLTARVSP